MDQTILGFLDEMESLLIADFHDYTRTNKPWQDYLNVLLILIDYLSDNYEHLVPAWEYLYVNNKAPKVRLLQPSAIRKVGFKGRIRYFNSPPPPVIRFSWSFGENGTSHSLPEDLLEFYERRWDRGPVAFKRLMTRTIEVLTEYLLV